MGLIMGVNIGLYGFKCEGKFEMYGNKVNP